MGDNNNYCFAFPIYFILFFLSTKNRILEQYTTYREVVAARPFCEQQSEKGTLKN